MPSITDVDICSQTFKTDPYPFYARWREESPVLRVALPDKQTIWLVTRYDDVVTVLKDDRFIKDQRKAPKPERSTKPPWVPKIFEPLQFHMLDVDNPDHGRLRGLVHKAFTPRFVEKMRDRIQNLTDELIDGFENKGQTNLIRDFALPLPSTVIAEMLGIPVRDRHRFHRWSNALLSTPPSKWGMLMAIPHVIAFLRYIRKLIKARQEVPGDDLTSALVHAREADDQLSENELIGMIFLLLIAGHETTLNLIGNGVLALLEHPDKWEQLRDDPGLIKPAIEELLRYDAPVQLSSERYALEDITLSGATIPRGEMIMAALGSANRDGRQFDRPDQLDLTRDPNRHLAFGQGIHYCVGAPLARMEGQIAFATLLRRLPELRLAVPRECLRWRRSLGLRGLSALPLTFPKRPKARRILTQQAAT